ncbi:MAG: tannase/feruloyl esterase family alpha/beta hydrolase [Campylobacter sp.]|nr:tannase/feruloyl esterase family alpha/beta hydrolase [Campylobacter sp.]
MKISRILPILLGVSALFGASDYGKEIKACEALKGAKIFNTQITQAKFLVDEPAPKMRYAALSGSAQTNGILPPHCLVHGEIEARESTARGINAPSSQPLTRHFGIKFELRLPAQWNGKFLFQGGGGMDGFVGPAIGPIPVHNSTATPSLMRGYAVVTSDSGHDGRDSSFADDQQARVNLAYAAIGKVTDVAKQLIAMNYRQAPKLSYFMGCSNGGRSALMAAQRFANDFDGIVATNPGFRLSRAAIAQSWDSQHILKVAPVNEKGEKIFADALTQSDLDKLKNAILSKCDELDGLKDGIINAYDKCKFDPATLEKEIGKSKVELIKAIFGGAKNKKGEQIYSGWFYDAGIASAGWRSWKLGDSKTAKSNALNITLGGDSLPYYFMTPSNAGFDPLKFDFDNDVAKTLQMGALHDAVSTDYSTFMAKGGKLIITTGVSDPVFSALDQRDYFVQLGKDMPKADEFAALFMVPGMTHCGGGEGLDNFDPLTALELWREKNIKPEFLEAKSTKRPELTQPLCSYPKYAYFKGGDASKIENYECRE